MKAKRVIRIEFTEDEAQTFIDAVTEIVRTSQARGRDRYIDTQEFIYSDTGAFLSEVAEALKKARNQ